MQDPLLTGPADQEFFRRVCREMNGASTQTVGNVAVNLLVNAVRQAATSRKTAESLIDFLFARAKSAALDQYDAVTGKPRVIMVDMPFHVEKNRVG